MKANDLPRTLLVELTADPAVRLFRNNVGTGWAGRAKRDKSDPSLVHVFGARPLHAGLCVGSSDLIGWRSVVITPAMVGQRVAVFVGLEAKTGGGVLTPEQRAFIQVVQSAGGLAGEVRSLEAARVVLTR
jgi:hypothetical protein